MSHSIHHVAGLSFHTGCESGCYQQVGDYQCTESWGEYQRNGDCLQGQMHHHSPTYWSVPPIVNMQPQQESRVSVFGLNTETVYRANYCLNWFCGNNCRNIVIRRFWQASRRGMQTTAATVMFTFFLFFIKLCPYCFTLHARVLNVK